MSQSRSSFTPGGAQTLSKMACRFPQVYPKTLSDGYAGHVWDDNGFEYIDLISGLGCISVGYADRGINLAALRQMNKGVSFSLPTQLEYLAAELLTKLVPGTEMWKFGKNGTDGTVMAVRAARAFTGRTKILTVGYNGCADQFEIKGVRNAGIPVELEPTIVRAEYNNLDSFETLLTKEYACVLMEPIVYTYPNVWFHERPDGFLEKVRQLCTDTGTVLIFDEVVMGGRIEGFTASRYFKVEPDLYVLSKGIANGFPLCAVGGTRRIMQTFERNDFFASGTFGGECVSLAAFMATSERLVTSIPQMIYSGSRIKEAFNKLPWDGVAECMGYPTRLFFKFNDPMQKAIFMQEMCLRRVLLGQANFIMASHTIQDVTTIINAIYEAFKSMRNGTTLIGEVPEETLRKSNK